MISSVGKVSVLNILVYNGVFKRSIAFKDPLERENLFRFIFRSFSEN